MLIYQYLQQQNSGHCPCCSGTGISSDQSLPSAVLYEGAPTIALPHPSSGDEPVNDPFAPLWMSRPKRAKKSAKKTSTATASSSNADTPTPMDVSDDGGTPTAPSTHNRKGSLTAIGGSNQRFQPPHHHHCCHPQGLSKSGGAAASGMMVVMEGEDMGVGGVVGLDQPGSSSSGHHLHNHHNHYGHHPNCGRQWHQVAGGVGVGMRLPYQHYGYGVGLSHHGTAGSGFRSVMAGGECLGGWSGYEKSLQVTKVLMEVHREVHKEVLTGF